MVFSKGLYCCNCDCFALLTSCGPAPHGVSNVPTVLAVMLIAVCEPDLVHCAPLETWTEVWESVEACNRDKNHILGDIQARNGNR